MKGLIPAVALATLSCFAFAELAGAQVVVQPGTEFPAAPMSKGGFSLSAPAQPIAAAPPPAPVVAPPPPEPAPRTRRKRRRG